MRREFTRVPHTLAEATEKFEKQSFNKQIRREVVEHYSHSSAWKVAAFDSAVPTGSEPLLRKDLCASRQGSPSSPAQARASAGETALLFSKEGAEIAAVDVNEQAAREP